MAERLHKDIFEEKVLQKQGLSLIDFYSDSCVPCKRISPILAELEESYGAGLFIGKVNIAYEPELAERYEVTAAPTLLLFKNGAVVEKLTGVVKKAELEKAIEANKKA